MYDPLPMSIIWLIPKQIAASKNQFAVVELLLREGADLDAVTDHGE
jgi:hypothetical protein